MNDGEMLLINFSQESYNHYYPSISNRPMGVPETQQKILEFPTFKSSNIFLL